MSKGDGDLGAGQFTHEVQTIYASALSSLAGSFKLTFEGKQIMSISVSEGELSFKEKLEALDTIHTVNVKRRLVDADIGAYAWTVTFTHMVDEMVQGAENVGLFTVTDTSSLTPATTAEIKVFENVRGHWPRHLEIPGSAAGVEWTPHTRRRPDLWRSRRCRRCHRAHCARAAQEWVEVRAVGAAGKVEPHDGRLRRIEDGGERGAVRERMASAPSAADDRAASGSSHSLFTPAGARSR